jgi:ABC-type amino acid transport substrate-binding protein
VAYAVADELGFARGEVEWTVVPFKASYAPGPKDFDFVPGSQIVGQFSAPGGDSFGLLLEKDSGLTECLDKAIASLDSSGQLEEITNTWMGAAAGAPELR